MPIDDAVHFAQLMHSGKYSDLMLVCAGQEFRVHKMIVCSQSSVIAAAVDGPFEESRTGVIDIQGFSAETVGDMVEFLYTGDYGDQPLPEVDTTASDDRDPDKGGGQADTSSSMLAQSLLRHVRTNAIADYYDISKLAELTRSKIRQAQLDQWDPYAWLDVTKNALAITGDQAFHDTLAQIVAHNASDFLDMDQAGEVMNEFSIRVFRHYIKAAKMDELLLGVQIYELKEELKAEQTRREVAETRTHGIMENMRNCMKTLRERDVCRNSSCNADFDCYIEERGQPYEPMFTLRCAKCRCKH